MKHLIIGNGPTGVIAAETIIRNAPQDQVVLLGDEPEPGYSRMAIPYLLMGNIEERGTWLRKEPQHFSKLGIHHDVGRAQLIDTIGRIVQLADGRGLIYDKLLIASGSSPILCIDSAGVHTCWTLEDARRIMRLARPGARVVQMCAGFIGCIIMEALAARGVALTVVEMGHCMVPRMMGPGAGGMIKAWCQQKGITVHTSTRVDAIAPGAPLTVTLSTGEAIEADLVISAIGVQPNICFVSDSGIHCKHGVWSTRPCRPACPAFMRPATAPRPGTMPAAGPRCRRSNPMRSSRGRCAGMNMSGRPARMVDVPQINVLDTLSLISTSFGRWDGVAGGDHAELLDAPGFHFLRLEFEEDRLVGSNAVGHLQHAGVLRGLIMQKVRLGAWKNRLIADPMRVTEAYIACSKRQDAWQQAH